MVDEGMQIFKYEGSKIRVFEEDGKAWFVASDIGKVLGLSKSAVSRICSKIKEKYIRFTSTHTSKGVRKLLTLSEEGMYKMFMQSRKPAAEPIVDWIAERVLPAIRKTGQFSSKKPTTAAQMLAAQVDALKGVCDELVRHELELQEHKAALTVVDDDLQEVKVDVDEIKSDIRHAKKFIDGERSTKARAKRVIASLPEPQGPPKEKTPRLALSEFIRAGCIHSDIHYEDAWNKIYREYKYIYHKDIKLRARRAGVKPLDVAEELGAIEDLHRIAIKLFKDMGFYPLDRKSKSRIPARFNQSRLHGRTIN